MFGSFAKGNDIKRKTKTPGIVLEAIAGVPVFLIRKVVGVSTLDWVQVDPILLANSGPSESASAALQVVPSR